MIITLQRLKELLSYDRITGEFRWIVAPRRGIAPGSIAGHTAANGYVQIGVEGKLYFAHRLAWLYEKGMWPEREIDHRIGKSNAWGNLRAATPLINRQNQRRAHHHNKSGLLGVSVKGKRFSARIQISGNQVRLGIFSTAQEAHAAYLSAKRKLHQGNTL